MSRPYKQSPEDRVLLNRAGADPALGAVSYSGADIKAIVFLPLDKEALRQEHLKLHEEITALEELYNKYLDLFSENVVDPAALYTVVAGFPPNYLQALKNRVKVLKAQAKEMAKVINSGNEFNKPLLLGDLQTISFSDHREKFPVRTLGRVGAKCYTRGGRTIAGSMIFTVINRHCLWELLQANLHFYNTGVRGSDGHYQPVGRAIIPDQLPPFDITLLASNELGNSSYMVLYGVEIVNEGQTLSIQDILTEDVMQFVARDYDPWRSIYDDRDVHNPEGQQAQTSSDLLDSVRRQQARLNPFI